MVNLYKEMKAQHQNNYNDFPMFFAFSQQQFDNGMRSLGLDINDTNKILDIGAGGFILKSDLNKYKNMIMKHEEEMKTAINTSDQFIFDMFNYELANHEYTYTYQSYDAINALGLTIDEIKADKRLLNGFEKACAYQRANDD